MKIYGIIVLVFLLSLPIWGDAEAAPAVYGQGGVVVSRVVRVIDGDTIVVDIDAWPGLFGMAIKLRLRGVDTPELHGKCPQEKVLALQAKLFVEDFLEQGRVVLTMLGRGSFFRVVASIDVAGQDLGESLIVAGLGRGYSLRVGRLPWCGVTE